MKLTIKLLQVGSLLSLGRGQEGEGLYGLVTEEDEVLYTHYCSNRGFAYGDLYGRRPERQKELKERFGEIEIT